MYLMNPEDCKTDAERKQVIKSQKSRAYRVRQDQLISELKNEKKDLDTKLQKLKIENQQLQKLKTDNQQLSYDKFQLQHEVEFLRRELAKREN